MIYTTIQLSGGNSTTSFKEKGLNGQMATRVEECGISGYQSGAPAYTLLIIYNLIHLYFLASLDEDVVIYQDFVNIFLRFNDTIPVAYPILQVEGVQGADRDTVVSYGMSEAPDARSGVYVGKPTLQHFRDICAMSLRNDNIIRAGHVNTAGYLAFIYAWKGVGIFSRTSQYCRPLDTIRLEVSPDDYEGHDDESTSKGKEKASAMTVDDDGSARMEATISISALNSPVFAPVMTPTQLVAPFFRTISHVYNGGGQVFPYFDGMVQPDKDIVLRVFLSLFSKCIGSSATEVSSLLAILRAGHRQLALSRQGMALTHVYFGIDLAMKTASRFFPLIEGGQYLGFVLGNESLTIIQRGQLIEAQSAEKLNEEVQTLSIHKRACTTVIEILEEAAALDDVAGGVDADKVRRSARGMAEEIYSRDLDTLSKERKDDLEKALDRVAFGETYWLPTPNNISIFIRYLMTNRWLDGDAPFFLGNKVGMSNSIIVRGLACFGPSAPSIFHGTKTMSIPRASRQDDNLNLVNNRRVLQYIPIYVKGIYSAASDWNSVRSKRSIKFFEGRKNKNEFCNRSKDAGIIADPHFGNFYGLLKSWLDSYEDVAGGKKRRLDEEGDPREPSTSKKRNTLGGIAGLF
jgi:hypothetical protein